MSDLFGKIMGQAFTSDDELTEEEYMNLIAKTFNSNYEEFDKVLIDTTVDIHLVKDDSGDWLVSDLDYELINLLSFNFLESMENIFAGLFGGFDIPDDF